MPPLPQVCNGLTHTARSADVFMLGRDRYRDNGTIGHGENISASTAHSLSNVKLSHSVADGEIQVRGGLSNQSPSFPSAPLFCLLLPLPRIRIVSSTFRDIRGSQIYIRGPASPGKSKYKYLRFKYKHIVQVLAV